MPHSIARVVGASLVVGLFLSALAVARSADAMIPPPKDVPTAGDVVLPFGLAAGRGGGDGYVCLKVGLGGHSEPPCDGASAGILGFLDFSAFGNSVVGTATDCSSGGLRSRNENNSAVGVDHELSTYGGFHGAVEVLDTGQPCGGTAKPNAAYVMTNTPQSFGAGMYSGTGYSDGGPGRLARVGTNVFGGAGQSTNVGGRQLDDNPLWEFLPSSFPAGAEVPASCHKSIFTDALSGTYTQLPTSPANVRSYVSGRPTAAERMRLLLQRCISHYNGVTWDANGAITPVGDPPVGCSGTCDDPIFTRNSSTTDVPDLYDIQYTARFGYVPELTAAFPAGNAAVRLQTFRPIFLQRLLGGTCTGGSCTHDFEPGVGYSNASSGSTADGITAFVLPGSSLPGDLSTGPPTAPDPPTDVLAAPGPSVDELTLQWGSPANTGRAAIAGYEVFAGSSPAALELIATIPGSLLEFIDTGLTPGEVTYYSVAAFTRVGTGPPSPVVSGTAAPGTVPGAPLLVSVEARDAAAIVSWRPPDDDGGVPITGYQVIPYVDDEAGTPVSFDSTATTRTVTGLVNGTTYRFRVRAVNDLGEGALSDPSGPVTPLPATAPGAPVIGVATAGDGEAVVSWSPPESDGRSAITGYRVTPYIGYFPLSDHEFASTATSQTITGLTNGTQYRFRVRAINAVGLGEFSKASNPVTPLPATAPGAPVIGVATAGDGEAVVSWSPPESDGRSAITGYRVTPYIGYFPLSDHEFASTATSQTITGLTNGTQYRFGVRAINVVGEGPESERSNIVTPSSPGNAVQPSSLTATPAPSNDGAKWIANATVTITGTTYPFSPIAGLIVTGEWTLPGGGATAVASCTTTASGTCVVQRTDILDSRDVAIFTITSVSGPGFYWTPGPGDVTTLVVPCSPPLSSSCD